MIKLNITELDCIFMSYDEPNAEQNWADLVDKCMWAKRVHGVKGSDECHKAAANLSETDWFITVDADNIVDTRFFDQVVELPDSTDACSWPGLNVLNGLRYGNGSLKLWRKDFVLNMRTHEAAAVDKNAVDFCWEAGYIPMMDSFSVTYPNASPYQAWRAGFREGVKMSLVNGLLPKEKDIKKLHWHNLHRLKAWMNIGSHVDNGLWAILGARHGCYKTNCTEWNHLDVRDFDKLKDVWKEVSSLDVTSAITEYGNLIEQELGIKTVLLDPVTSEFIVDTFADQYNQTKEQILWVMSKHV
jgi:hypothetical protein